MDIQIKQAEHGVIRVFAVNRASADLTSAVKSQGKAAVATEMLGQKVPESGFEFFPVADLTGVGLAGYLSEGYAVSADQLKDARSKLDALDGYVLLLFSSTFERQDITLTPSPDLTLIGTFGETQPDMSVQALQSEAAQDYSQSKPVQPNTPAKRNPTGSLIVALLIALAGLVLWLVLR